MEGKRGRDIMRVFSCCLDLINETTREVFARGQLTFDKTVQGVEVDRENYEAKELLGYCYTVSGLSNDLDAMLVWARDTFYREHLCSEIGEAWFQDMLVDKNPDDWWRKSGFLTDYWTRFGLHHDGTFSYTYGERIADNIDYIVQKLQKNLYSRGAVLGVWDWRGDPKRTICGLRIPCTISYHFVVRKDLDGDKMHLFVYQRSCDLVNFFALDVFKAILLLRHVASRVGVMVGSLTHYIDSLHAYIIDVPDDKKW